MKRATMKPLRRAVDELLEDVKDVRAMLAVLTDLPPLAHQQVRCRLSDAGRRLRRIVAQLQPHVQNRHAKIEEPGT